MAVWDAFLTEQDRAVFARSGHGARAGFGQRPALLVVEVSYAFCGDKDEPFTNRRIAGRSFKRTAAR